MLDEFGVAARLRAAGCVFAEDEARVLLEAAPDPDRLADMIAERESGRPLEQIVGWAEFCGLRIRTAPGVFVPRRRTELLVEQAAACLDGAGGCVVELCCGTAAVSAALAERLPSLEVHAADIDADAVGCARGNLGSRAAVHQGDLYAALPPRLRGHIDVLVANAPYVPSDHIALMPTEARVYEKRVALDGGGDGLAVQRRIIADAPSWLAPGGRLVIETSAAQAAGTVAVAQTAGLAAEVVRDVERDATAVVSRRAGSRVRSISSVS